MLLQNKFSFFRSFFFTSLFVLSIFIFSPSAEAVGATPPAISYDPYTYENIVPQMVDVVQSMAGSLSN